MKKLLSQLILIALFLIPQLIMCNQTCMAAWTPMSSGTLERLYGVWGSSGSDVFVVGGAGTISHYNGSNWASMVSGTTAWMIDVWGTSGSDVFAVGSGATILHYNGSNWASMNSGVSGFLDSVWGSSAGNVFAVGNTFYDLQGIILHYDGSIWAAMNIGTIPALLGVWGTSGSDIFAVGADGTILHYNGSNWIAMNSGTSIFFNAVWGSSGSDVFAVGGNGIILHYDGSSWNAMNSPTTEMLHGVWGSSGSDVFAVGDHGTILHYNGSNWTAMNSGTSEFLNAVWGSSGSEIFAVGANGTILHYDGIECLAHGDCDDGLYCNGTETCDTGSHTCLPGTPVVCPDGEICDEGSNQCRVPPECSLTIIPSSVTIYTWDVFQFSTTLDGICNEPCYTWEIAAGGCTGNTTGSRIGSTIDANGFYIANGMAGRDVVRAIDECNGNICGTATVNVVSTTTTTVPPCIPDGYEPDDILPAANPVAPNSCQAHSICPIGDHDFLQFELAAESGVILETFGPYGDTVICLYNSNGNEIACNDDGGSGLFSYIEQSCLPAGTYFIEIFGYADGWEIPEYEICLTLNPCPLPVPLDCNKLLASSQFGELFRIDVTTGRGEFIGYMPSSLATEIEYDDLTQTLYAEEVDGYQNLHIINPERGTSLGYVTHEFGSLQGLEFVGSTLYGTFFPSATLVIVDTSTGNLTTVGPTGLAQISGLAYDKRTGIMYGITAGGSPANLVRINLTTGAATVIGPTGLDRIGSIEFGPDGTLYGGVTAFGSSFASYLIRIDTATGAVTPIANTGFSITGLTACQAGMDIIFDIKPNPLNLKCQGVMPAAILGTEEFDVNSIDPDSLRLTREGIPDGVAPIRYNITDGTTPAHSDMLLKFRVQDVVETLMLNELAGQTIPLTITGETADGASIRGQDYVRLLGNITRECHSDFDCDADVDGSDAVTFKDNYGRSKLRIPCSEENPCDGDFDKDSDVDGKDAVTFKSSYGTILWWQTPN